MGTIKEFKSISTNEASKRLVAVNFQGLLPAYLAHDIMKIIEEAKVCSVADKEYRKEIYS